MSAGGGVWLWVGLLWNDRVRSVLDRYGDRITDISIFGWEVDAGGRLSQTFNPAQLDPYRAKWPHIRWWACFMNHGVAPIFTALQNDAGARARLVADLGGVIDRHPWLHGVDIDLERGGSNTAGAEAVFRAVADGVHGRGRKVSAALPALTASGSIGGEHWVRYRELGAMLDHVAVMSYDFAWAGSAPGPVSPWSWMRQVYDWAASQIPPHKLSMGVPAYGRMWRLHDYPENLTTAYRGSSTATYPGARLWLDGSWIIDHPTDPDPQPHIGWLAYRDPDDPAPWAWIHVYDACDGQDHRPGSASGLVPAEWGGRRYVTRFPAAAGSPLWSMADQRAPGAGADYTLTSQPYRDRYGRWVAPKAGFTLTAELLKRAPDSAAIWDDDLRTPDILATDYYRRGGIWSQWTDKKDTAQRQYAQARCSADGGTLDLGHSFGSRALHVQARAQLPTGGTWGVHVGTVRATVNPAGVLELRAGSTLLATGYVPAAGTSTTPRSARAVVGLRVRGRHARVYASLSENSVPLRLEATVPAGALTGSVGVWSSGALWVDHVRVGDGWWYQPQEAVRVELGNFGWTVGRIPREGVQWDAAGRFRPIADVEESATRSRDISLDWDYDHVVRFPVNVGDTRTVTVRPLDPGVWLGRLLLGDANGFGVLHYSDADYLGWLRDRAAHDYGLQGIAVWTLGQEDPRLWERLAGGQLAP